MSRPDPSLLAIGRGEIVHIGSEDEFIESAVEHRMVGLVFSLVSEGTLELSPPAVASLAKLDLSAAAHHQRLWSTLEEVTSRFSSAGIDSVAFKGVVDEARWFSRVGERPCSDVDLMIEDEGAFDDAVALLRPDHPLLGQLSRLANQGHIRSLDLRVGNVWLDLHVDPLKVGRGWHCSREWLDRTEPLTTPSGAQVRVFDAEATAALKLLHVGKDRFRYLLSLVEVARLLEDEIDWDVVRTLAADEGILEPVLVAAQVVAEEMRLERPQPRLNNWRARMWRHLWGPQVRLWGEAGRYRFGRRSQWIMPLTMPGRALETVTWMARTAVPPSALFDLKHPGGRGPYPWRLVSRRLGYLANRRREANQMFRDDLT
jgi:hypothetical protein